MLLCPLSTSSFDQGCKHNFRSFGDVNKKRMRAVLLCTSSHKIPSGINNGNIIAAENNADGWESPEINETWPTHMLTADVPNNSFHSFCFVYEIKGATPQYSL